MKKITSNIVLFLVIFCFSFVGFAVQPVEATTHHGKAGISASAKHKKAVKKAKKVRKTKKSKKGKKAKKKKVSKVKRARHSSINNRQLLQEDPSAQ